MNNNTNHQPEEATEFNSEQVEAAAGGYEQSIPETPLIPTVFIKEERK